ncbi:MAG: hypothetical protein HRT88_07505 [Lentisphaeraceae bacterium]|nr:hypothetical protein [Lentisphaeraceae bacterium]
MIVNLEGSNKAVQVMATQSRRADLLPVELSEVHRAMGRVLSYEYLNRLKLETIEISHVQGPKKGLDIAKDDFTLILTMMRSGLYVAEGFREILNSHARIEFVNGTEDVLELIAERDFSNLHIVLVDSVINTGKSIEDIIDILPKCKSITGACQVMHEGFTASTLANRNDINFITCRISKNFYVGKGKTDTGDRLLGHVPEVQKV